MSNGPAKVSQKASSRLTPEQKDWLKKLGTLVGGAAAGGKDDDAKSSTTAPVRGVQPRALSGSPDDKRELTEGLGVPGLGDIPGIVKDLLSNLSCKCKLSNNTDKTLKLDPGSIKFVSGKFRTDPPAEIKPHREGKFVAVNKFPNTAGVDGELIYLIDDKKTGWRVRWNNPRIGDNTSETDVRGPNKDQFDVDQDPGQGPEADFLFSLDPVGGPAPGPVPPGPQPGVPPSAPGPAPAQDVKSSCMITVNNNTKLVLTLADQGHDRGDFMTFPPPTIQPNSSAQFVSVETPHAKEQGCKGFVSWEVGSPVAAIWRIEWDNPESEKNTAKATAEPQTAGFRSVSQIGQDDENVPAIFTLSGGGAGPAPAPSPSPGPTPAPSPAPGPDPGPEPEFNAPPGSRQPTLRKGDKSPDGWVEYMQRQLNLLMGANTVEVDGNFGSGTEKAVKAFQKKFNLQVDGTVGNQTWAALRSGTPEAPSTDGRKPHTFEQKDLQARWDVEKNDAAYIKSSDTLSIFVTNVGEGKIDDFFATVRITPPDTKSKTVKVKIGPPDIKTKTGQGDSHSVKLPNFKKTFPAKDPNANLEDYLVEAFFDKELGPDLFKGKIEAF